MPCRWLTSCCLLLSLVGFGAHGVAASQSLTSAQLARIGDKIYGNETGGNPDYLIAWNRGESFASLGIGHFIWFPKGLDSPFTESFPAFVQFLQANDIDLPTWLNQQTDCPWRDQNAFLQAKNSTEMGELKALLNRTVTWQVAFIRQRQQRALPLMLSAIDDDKKKHKVSALFAQLASTEAGAYALIDYVNFKGEGTSPKERYQGQGWGLLQVLLHMLNQSNQLSFQQQFSEACKAVLSRRVSLSPQRSTEQGWLAGWHKRCDTYSVY